MWTAKDIKRGVQAAVPGRPAAIIFQVSANPTDDLDEYVLAHPSTHAVRPWGILTAERMADLLNTDGFIKIG